MADHSESGRLASAGRSPRRAGSPRGREPAPAPASAEAAEAVIAIHEPSWRNPKSEAQGRASLQTYAYPSLGGLPVSEITPDHVMAVLEPLSNEKRTWVAPFGRSATPWQVKVGGVEVGEYAAQALREILRHAARGFRATRQEDEARSREDRTGSGGLMGTNMAAGNR